MIAYVSGEAARGALLREGQFHGYLLDLDQRLSLSKAQLRNFFLNAWDVELIECASEGELLQEMESRWKQDRALRLVLIALDSKQRQGTRVDAAKCADELLCHTACHAFVLNHLYSMPLPTSCDVNEVSSLLADADAPILEEIFDSLAVRQVEVKNCVDAWRQIPDEVFESEVDRAEMRARIVRTGAFYRFAAFDTGSNDSLFRILADPIIAKQASKGRQIVARWASRYKEMPSRPKFEFLSDGERWLAGDEGGAGGESGFEVFQRVKKQKAAIKEEYLANNCEKADALVEMLIRDQRAQSSPEHLAKSLCDLATFCKSLGDLERFFRFTLRATEEAPGDAWAFVQLGNAFSAKGEFSRAIGCYERSEILGDERASLIGRAEAFKYMGQKDVALQVLDRCIRDNPNDPISKGCRASLLAHFGAFNESLVAYDELIASQLGNAYAFGGRAGVLYDLGRREDALRDQEMSVYLAGDDPIPHCAKAEMLREQGRFHEALSALDVPRKQPHAKLQMDSVRSRIYRDMGDFEASEFVLRGIHESYPRDVMSRVALADLFRRKGRLAEALELFLRVEGEFPGSRLGRNGIAATFAALGRFEEAVLYLPARGASTRSEWIAQHIRAMIDVKLGNWSDARSALVDGLDNCPWHQQKPYFATALASLDLQQGRASEAAETLDRVKQWVTPLTASAVDAVAAHVNFVVDKRAPAFDRERVLGPLVELFVRKLEAASIASANDADVSAQLFDLEWKALLSLAA